jgi:predicted RNase H-like HicB family nuclease/predicted DNA-binding protein YlxM (UPF0122 family)
MPGERVAAMSKRGYVAVYELDDNGSWFVHVPDLKGAHSHGRSLAQARKNIREAVALVLDMEPEEFFLFDRVQLAPDIERLVTSVKELRTEADEMQEFATWATEDVVKNLSFGEHPLSLRDIADVLGISFQRVHQIRQRLEQSATDDLESKLRVEDALDLMEALRASVEATRGTRGKVREALSQQKNIA